MNKGEVAIKPGDLKGFTLLEILISISILAVILATIYSSYTGTYRVIDQTECQAEICTMASIAMERMAEDLESTYFPVYGDSDESNQDRNEDYMFIGEDREVNGRAADGLRFASTAHIDLGGRGRNTGATVISYLTEEASEGEGLILYRKDSPFIHGTLSGDIEDKGLVLCEGLAAVDFKYYDQKGGIFQSWDSLTQTRGKEIPGMIFVALEFENPLDHENPVKFTTKVAVPCAQQRND